jgi:hypothetical protein
MKKPLLFISSLLLVLSTFAFANPVPKNPVTAKKGNGEHHFNLKIEGSSIIPVCTEPIDFSGGLLLRGTFVENDNNAMYDLDISSQGLSGVGLFSGAKYHANVKASASGHFSATNEHRKIEFKVRVLLTKQGSGKEVAATLKFFVVVSANGENYNVEPSTFYLDFGNCIPE